MSLYEINRILKPGGKLFFTVPFLWNLHDVPFDEYRFTPFSLKRLLEKAGLGNIKINALGGWNASLAQMLGLWIKRSPIPDEQRNKFAEQFFSFYKFLIKNDVKPQEFTEGTMFTGLSGLATKSVDNIKDERFKEI